MKNKYYRNGKDRYLFSNIEINETSFVENIVKNMMMKDVEDIGWEVSYPDTYETWKNLKVDIAFDYIKDSEYFFESVVEVKKFVFENNKSSDLIWYDIFKILGYSSEDERVGSHKYILLYYQETKDIDPHELIRKEFIHQDCKDSPIEQYLKNKLIKNNWTKDEIDIIDSIGINWKDFNILEPIHSSRKEPGEINASLLKLKI